MSCFATRRMGQRQVQKQVIVMNVSYSQRSYPALLLLP